MLLKVLLAIPLSLGSVYLVYKQGQDMLWGVGFGAAAYIFWATSGHSTRQLTAAERFRKLAGGVRRVGEPLKKKGKSGGSVPRMPNEMTRLITEALGGREFASYELHRKNAYLAMYGADAASISDHQSVVMRLTEKAPTFTVRPLPIIEGKRVANRGILFSGDKRFSTNYLVEGTDARGVRAFLHDELRKAMLRKPDLWLVVSGKLAVLARFGECDEHQLMQLVEVADELYAEHGAGEGAALVPALESLHDGEAAVDDDEPAEAEESRPAKPKKKKKKPASTESATSA